MPMRVWTFLVENQELLATLGSLLVAALGALAALLNRHRQVIHVYQNEPPEAVSAALAALAPARVADLPLALSPSATAERPAEEAVRAAEEELLRRHDLARQARPALPLPVLNRLQREVARAPGADLGPLCALAAGVPPETVLPYLERLAELERAWNDLVALRQRLGSLCPRKADDADLR
jgi:hypothetical protein